MQYRNLTPEEINVLTNQGCIAENWNNVLVHSNFSPEYVTQTQFSGNIKIGFLEKEFILPGGIKRHSAINKAIIHNCELGNNIFIENVQNYIANYRIGNDVFIQNIHLMYAEGITSFGNGTEVAVLNETGGRNILMNNELSSHFAYIFSFYRHRPLLIKKLQTMVYAYVDKIKSDMGIIEDQVKIINTGTIKNVYIGKYAVIESARHLENGSINSNESDPIHIGYNVIANDFIISSGSRIEDGTMLTRCFIGQACQLGHTYSAQDSLFFSNCQGENGEACSVFAGPYTVTHHKSTLLIAGMFSFMNAGSGSNQSNHMYKLGPIHQGIIERGGKTTSNSYILWPSRVGAFSLIMGRHYHNSDTSSMPFSYLIEDKGESVLVPGINLRSVGTIRDAQKFPKRDRRQDPDKLDQINFNLLSPYTVQKMFRGVEILKELQETCGETSDTYTYQSCKINASSLRKGLIFYDMAIVKFLGNSLISRLKNCACESDEDIRECLKPASDKGLNEWRDISGMLTPRSEIDYLIDMIETDKITTIKEINSYFQELHKNYYSLEWTWAWDKIQQYFGVDLDTITSDDVIDIVKKWKKSVITLDKWIYEDAKKEFSLSSRTSFGLDGNRYEQKIDFEQVRGIFEENAFIKVLTEHINEKTILGDNFIKKLRKSK